MSAYLDMQEQMIERMTDHLEKLGEQLQDGIARCIEAAYNNDQYCHEYDLLFPERLPYPSITKLLDQVGDVTEMLKDNDTQGYFDRYVGEPDQEVD